MLNSKNYFYLIDQHQKSYQNFIEIALEMIMAERDLQTSYSGAAANSGHKISTEFSVPVPLNNMLKDFLNI